MRKICHLPLVLVLASIVVIAIRPAGAASSKSWPPVTDEEKAIKDCPQQPGASAIYLYREEVTDSDQGEYRVFRRLKILTPAGRDRANIEIPYFKGETTVRDLEARVVPPQGEPREFTGQVFEKTAFRIRGIRMTVKTFALPDVEAGSIIDYRYKIVRDTGRSTGDAEDILDALQISPGKPREGPIGKDTRLLSIPADNWEVQEELFTRKAKFVYIPSYYIDFIMDIIFNGPGRLMWFTQRIPNIRPAMKDQRLELELEDVPAFEAEELMTPEESEKMAVNIFYSDSRFEDFQEYWKLECQNWQKAAEGFIGDARKLTVETQKLIEGVTDPNSKLKRLYERAQLIRNLSYEKYLTSKQRKAQKIKDNRKAAEVLEHGYGFRSDITRTFVALARAAGFEAEVARVSTRDDKLFRIKLLSFTEQLDSEVAIVKLEDKELLFDPATPFCPFGLVHWTRSNATAVRYSKTPPAFFTTSAYPPEMALTQRELELQVDPQGGLVGTAKVTYTGHEALVRRLDYIRSDEADRKKGLEEELSGILPMGAGVTLKQLDNIDNSAADITLLFDISIPGVVTMAGDKMLLPASPLLGARQYPFRHARRKYPIYFPYPFREFNDIVISLPEGMTVETRPEPRKNERDFAACSLVCVPEGARKLHVQRDLVIKKSFFLVDQYAAIKGFYDWVRASDEEQVVLVREKR